MQNKDKKGLEKTLGKIPVNYFIQITLQPELKRLASSRGQCCFICTQTYTVKTHGMNLNGCYRYICRLRFTEFHISRHFVRRHLCWCSVTFHSKAAHSGSLSLTGRRHKYVTATATDVSAEVTLKSVTIVWLEREERMRGREEEGLQIIINLQSRHMQQ